MTPLHKPYTADVEAFHQAIAALVAWVVADGGAPEEILDAVEKPWRWADEASAAQSVREAMATLGDA